MPQVGGEISPPALRFLGRSPGIFSLIDPNFLDDDTTGLAKRKNSRVPALRAHVQRLIEAGRLNVVLDLSGVTFADSTVVGEIASTHTALQRRGGRLTLLNPSKQMSRLLSISRLASVIEIIRRSTDLTELSPLGGD